MGSFDWPSSPPQWTIAAVVRESVVGYKSIREERSDRRRQGDRPISSSSRLVLSSERKLLLDLRQCLRSQAAEYLVS